MSHYYTYILTNRGNRVLYTGMTNNLKRRMNEHKEGIIPGFTKKYKTHKLVYFETYSTPDGAIEREKQIKGWLRSKKLKLINAVNPDWRDLCDDF